MAPAGTERVLFFRLRAAGYGCSLRVLVVGSCWLDHMLHMEGQLLLQETDT